MALPQPRALNAYLLGVSLTGFAVMAVLVAEGPWVEDYAAETMVLAACVLLGELLPIKVPRHQGTVTTSTAFAFAILLAHGTATAAVVLALASCAADLAHRRGALGTAFNAAQYGLSMAAAGGTLALFGYAEGAPAPHFGAEDLPAIVCSGAVFFFANNTLAATASALAERAPVVRHLVEDFMFQALTAAMLLGLAPVVVVATDFSIALLPFLALPLVAVYSGARQAERNDHQAYHDALTGLPNRALFHERALGAIDGARQASTGAAILIMDADRFKEINDSLGHRHGDLLLQAMGMRVRAALRDADTVARLGGDEFGVVLPRLEHPEAAFAVAERIVASLEEPFTIDGISLDVQASVGIACFPADGSSVDELVQHADIAMYAAKGTHRPYARYEPSQDATSLERLEFAGQLRRALDHGELVLHYQPKLDLRTGRFDSVEALVRWQHPVYGLVAPDRFIPVAEQTGVIGPMTLHLIEVALRQVMEWRRDGIALAVAVNLSPRSLVDGTLPTALAALLRRLGADASSLQLEITETTVMADPDRGREALRRLNAMGIRLSIDDFGTGYSSLGYLRSLPVSELKIDRSFVLGMGDDESDAAIVRATAELAHTLGLEVVAEGVETSAALSDLYDVGCDYAQGFLLSPALPADEFRAWALDGAAWAAAAH